MYSFNNATRSSFVRKLLTLRELDPQQPYVNHVSPPILFLCISDIRYIVKRVFIYIGYPIHYISGATKDNSGYCCDMRGMLGFLILFLLSKKPMHGQEIAEEIAKRKGEKPSPGTIYPALKNLREMGFIVDEKSDGKIIVYNLTQAGKNALIIAKRRFVKIFLGVFP